MIPILINGTYKHTNSGAMYKVLHIGLQESTYESQVVYQSLKKSGNIWIRPLDEFKFKFEPVEEK